jgi:paraquat-inducible protein B
LADRADLDREPIAEPEVRRSRGISAIWLFPLVALAIGGWLAYRAVVDQGPLVTIRFDTAEGLEAGKTQVRFKDVAVGVVEGVRLSDDLAHVLITARMAKTFEPFVNDRASFWIVRPRVGVGGVSGLGTLLSGAYVEIDTRSGGTPQRAFDGVEEPPLIRSTVPGTRYVLLADELGGVSRGAPIFHRGIQVGEVLGYALAADGASVTIPVFVRAPFDALITSATRFWQAGGVRLTTGPGGVPEVVVPPLQALLIGGVEFDTAPAATRTAALPGASFTLFASRVESEQRPIRGSQPFLVSFEGSVRGLRPGAAVEFRGIEVGRVRSVDLAFDEVAQTLRLPVVIEIEARDHSSGIAPTGVTPDEIVAVMTRFVERGVRARLDTGNLLTGDLIVTLDFYPDAPPATLGRAGDLPVIPSVPSQIQALTASVTGVLKRLATLPIEDIAAETRATIRAFGALAEAPELKAALTSLDAALATLQGSLVRVDRLAAAAERDVPGVLEAARGAAAAAAQTLQQARVTVDSVSTLVGPTSPLRYELNEALKQLATAARSIREFAAYLERQPDALIRGRQERR